VGAPVVGSMLNEVGILLVGECVSPSSVGFPVVGIAVVGSNVSVGEGVVGL